MSHLQIKQTKSGIGEKIDARRTLVALGIKRNGQTVSHEDSPTVRGMLRKIAHLVSVEEAAK